MQRPKKTVRLVVKHGTGFYYMNSSKGETWFPDDKGNLVFTFTYSG